MSKVSNLRLLLPSSSSLFLSKKPFLLFPFSRSLFSKPSPQRKTYFSPLTALSYGGRYRRRGGRGSGSGGGVSPQRRGNSTLREGGGREKERGSVVEMEDGEDLMFNKRRAEGNDRGGKGKAFQLKTRKLNPINTICYLQILGTGMDTQDTSPSILLFFDKQRFIFNAGEGLQRFCTEHKIKLSKIDHIFLTRVCSETGGGLPGLVLTLAGIGEEGMSVNIWGPSDLDFLVDAMRSFIPRKAMLHTHSFGLGQNNGGGSSPTSENVDSIILVDDEVVRISAIFVKPGYSKSSINNLKGQNLDLLDGEIHTSQYLHPKAQSSQSFQGETELTLKPGDTAVVYACELPKIMGKFDPVKAASKGLKPGPKYRELQLGNSVMSDDLKTMVKPKDVLDLPSPGPIVLLVDCPTISHMHELLSLRSLNCYYANSSTHPTKDVKRVTCIIHLGPASVTKSVEYQNWMRKFGDAQHIMAGHEMKNMKIPILKASARISSRLNYVCPQLFPAPGFWSAEQINNAPLEKSVNAEDTSLTLCSTSAENLLKFHLRPHSLMGLDKSAIPGILSHKEIVDELVSEIPEIKDISNQISQLWQSPPQNNAMMPPEDDNVIMVEEPWINESSLIPIAPMQKKRLDISEDGSHLTGSWEKGLEDNLDIPSCLENITREDMEIILLGTGSSQPSKYRNVSSVFVNLFARGSLLLDCGEGTLAQLKRRFGVKGADNAVTSLRCIWISHIHADHHTGLVRILALRCQLLKGVPHKPLLVIGPRPLERFLKAYSGLEDLNMQFLDCRHTLKATVESSLGNNGTGRVDSSANSNYESNRGAGLETVTSHQLESTLFAHGSRMESYRKKPGIPIEASMALVSLRKVLFEAGLEFLQSVPVLHCPEAFGVVLKSTERVNSLGKPIPGWKLVYSGDTRPCPALIEASNDATVLIHEATFEDSMRDEAINRNHSTTKEAIGVGTSAGAYRIILTHFSQRYPKIPVFDKADMHKACIAFDLMSVNLADLPVLPNVLPYLKVLFRNEMMADESDESDDDQEESAMY